MKGLPASASEVSRLMCIPCCEFQAHLFVPGYFDYRMPNETDPLRPYLLNCQPCPKGTDCNREGVSFGDIATLPGWWYVRRLTASVEPI